MINQSQKIIKFLLTKVRAHPNDIVSVASIYFDVTRTTIHRHLSKLIHEGAIIKGGTTRDVRYFLSDTLNRQHVYKILPQLSEFEVFKKDFDPILKSLQKNIYDILNYTFTEIFNNAIDHSYGTTIGVRLSTHKENIIVVIQDDGIGIFKRLASYFTLDDLREGVLLLSKGKMTTDPVNHSGEGIFFTSRILDSFEIFANNIHYIRNNLEDDWSVETISKKMIGSMIRMQLSKNSTKELTTIFKKYATEDDDYEFNKTDIIVAMSRWGDETLISRSQAKRILRGLEKFKKVTLDFKDVRLIGQGFVDEIFRVFQQKYPNIVLDYINTNEDVLFMIKRLGLGK